MDDDLTAGEQEFRIEASSKWVQDTQSAGPDKVSPSHITAELTGNQSSALMEVVTQPSKTDMVADEPSEETALGFGLIPIPFHLSLAGELARAKATRDKIPFQVTGDTRVYPFNNQLFLVIERICACGRAQMIPDDDAKMNAPLIEQIVSGHRKFNHDVNVGIKRKIFMYGPCKCNPRLPSVGKKDVSRLAPASNTLDKWAMYTCGHTKPLQEQARKPLREGQRPEMAREPISADMKCVYIFRPCSTECVTRFDKSVGAYEYVQGWFDEACSETVSGSGWMIGF